MKFLLTGAKQPNYLVTADDVDTYLAIEVQPLDNRKRKVFSALFDHIFLYMLVLTSLILLKIASFRITNTYYYRV